MADEKKKSSSKVHIPLVKHSSGVKTLKDIEVPQKFFQRMTICMHWLSTMLSPNSMSG